MGKADLHIHSTASDGLASPREILDYIQDCTDLDLVGITDHDMFEGSVEAAALARERRYRFQVIVGMEITTLEGHLLAYDIQKPIGMLQPLDRSLREIHRQGGFVILPHPMSPLVRSIGRRGVLRVHRSDVEGVRFDGIEIINPSLAGKVVYEKILDLNRELGLPQTAGSDSHTLDTISSAFTLYPGSTADEYRLALKAGLTQAGGSFWGMAETQRLLKIARQQLYQSWLVLPGKHIRRHLNGRQS